MIYLLHGTASEWRPHSFTYRNLLALEALERFLAIREKPFVDLERALESGDALTVDDATCAGADVCRRARRHGHAVTFFVNPFNVATARPYFFAILNVALDRTQQPSVSFKSHTFPLIDWDSKRAFRAAAKKFLLQTGEEDAMHREVATICNLLGVPDPPVPHHLQSVTRDELLELRDLGVRIESHGWTHIDVSHATPTAITEHLEDARSWLRNECGVDSQLYAVPFGESDLPSPHASMVRYRFLADTRQPEGKLRERCWNRIELDPITIA